MRVLVLAAAAAVMAGCAAPVTIEQARARLAAANDYQVCQAAILGDAAWSQLAEEQRRYRGLDCAPYASTIIAQDAARRQQALQAYQIMQASQPAIQSYQPIPMPPAPRSINCTSQRLGNQVQTSCN